MNEMKNTIAPTPKAQAGKRICELKDGNSEIIRSGENKERRMKKCDESLCDLWDNIKRNNLQIIGVAGGGEEKEKTIETLF